jgi:hypothetical protein
VCGEKVGTALEYDALNQYLRVEHGWLVPVLISMSRSTPSRVATPNTSNWPSRRTMP